MKNEDRNGEDRHQASRRFAKCLDRLDGEPEAEKPLYGVGLKAEHRDLQDPDIETGQGQADGVFEGIKKRRANAKR